MTRRSTWTDSRLDDLNERVTLLGSRFDSLQQVLLVVGGGVLTAFVALLAAVIGLIATRA